MEQFELIGWPEIQEYMDKVGFRDNSTLVEPKDELGIGSSTYLVSIEWLKKLPL